MAANIVPVRAEVDAVWCVTAAGISVALTLPHVQQLLAKGVDRVDLGDVLLKPTEPPRPWLTVTMAAHQLLQDMRPSRDAADHNRLLRAAKAMITRACNSGHIVHNGIGHQRHIEPDSFGVWCLARRRRADLD